MRILQLGEQKVHLWETLLCIRVSTYPAGREWAGSPQGRAKHRWSAPDCRRPSRRCWWNCRKRTSANQTAPVEGEWGCWYQSGGGEWKNRGINGDTKVNRREEESGEERGIDWKMNYFSSHSSTGCSQIKKCVCVCVSCRQSVFPVFGYEWQIKPRCDKVIKIIMHVNGLYELLV